jgi:hypothetical protein
MRGSTWGHCLRCSLDVAERSEEIADLDGTAGAVKQSPMISGEGGMRLMQVKSDAADAGRRSDGDESWIVGGYATVHDWLRP